ncbi:MAG: lipid IV(A) 3-deoxy-D-manno-octulosonic acid transferase [Gammaproteobacteria bacterium]
MVAIQRLPLTRRLYTLLLYFLTPLVMLRLLWRGLRVPAYWRRWPERFGWIPHSREDCLWIHAVSVGEVQAAVPLIKALRSRYPPQRIVVTTMTPTGAEHAQAVLSADVTHYYAPYDLPQAVQRFLQRARPRLLIIMETELWPNLIHTCYARAIPVILANARLSERSATRYRRIKKLMTETLEKISIIAAQTQPEAERFIELGARPDTVHVTGSIKYDVKLSASLREEAQVLRRLWGVERAVWIAASTHEGEEAQLIDAYAAVRRELPHALLVIVPRHPERFTKVAALCQKRGYRIVRRSEQRPCDANTEIVIGDSMGELNLFYAASDVAFVGGSLAPNGGHNLIEPAALGVPVITGPYTFNFAEVTQQLCEAGAAVQIHNTQQLSNTVVKFLKDANLRYQTGEKGRELVERNRGALNTLLEIIARYLSRLNE